MQYDWNDPLPFGKYKGMLISEIASFNPKYLAWAVNNLSKFDLTPNARKLGQRELNKHREQSMQRQNGWAWGFGKAVKSAASAWSARLIHLEHEARNRAANRKPATRDQS
ncbi:hypothetical protein [Sphingobium sp. BS19]|uniref:exodeoxyribonuclease X C-terminal domain-containing protein n=1 Tax=Sphingobium sp. BS19 TaxID=3018973 RepID=UPI0022EF423E|nr:hypothetical protein [Sphingobium sp. BS19]GLI99100.1 hypothetical protein Sbs19_29180 [Sphingobium sp. BS19]